MNNIHTIGNKMLGQFTVFLCKFDLSQVKYLKVCCMSTHLNF